MNQPVSVLKGTVLLALAGFIVKLMGAVYRILLARLIGVEGIGLYQMAYPVYLVFLSLSTAGIPIALSKLIAEKEIQNDVAGVRVVFQAALILLFGLGITCSLTMGFSARWLAEKVVADPRAVLAIRALAPAIFFMSLLAVFRGYFQGMREMGLSAVSQIIEQAVRVAVAIILAISLINSGVEYAAAGAAFGATAGGAAALLYLVLIQLGTSWPTKIRTSWKSISRAIKRIIRFAIPISIAVILMPVLQTLDSIIVPIKLQSIGYTVQQATSMLGLLGNSWAVLYLPMIVTGAIVSNLVPVVASLNVIGKYNCLKQKVENGLRMGAIWLVPVAVSFYWFGRSIFRILYGFGDIELLSWFASAVIFLGFEQITAGILQGLGKPIWPLLNFSLGAGVKIGVTLITIGWPGLNLTGAALGTVCGSGVTAGLNFLALQNLVKIRVNVAPIIGAGVVMLIACGYLIKILNLNFIWEMIIAGGGSLLIYIFTLLILGGIKSSDLEVIGKFLEKRGIWNV